MNSNKKTARILEDVKINVKIKLSALWVTVMLCYIYGDYFELYIPGKIENLMAKVTSIGPTTPILLLVFSISIAIPALMVFLSLTLKPRINRWVNIILGGFYTLMMLLTMINPTSWMIYYMFLGVIEIILTVLIVWYAWKWPKQEA